MIVKCPCRCYLRHLKVKYHRRDERIGPECYPNLYYLRMYQYQIKCRGLTHVDRTGIKLTVPGQPFVVMVVVGKVQRVQM